MDPSVKLGRLDLRWPKKHENPENIAIDRNSGRYRRNSMEKFKDDSKSEYFDYIDDRGWRIVRVSPKKLKKRGKNKARHERNSTQGHRQQNSHPDFRHPQQETRSRNVRSTRTENKPSGNIGQKSTKKSSKKWYERRNMNLQNEVVLFDRVAQDKQRAIHMQTQMVKKKQSVEMIHFTVFDQLLVALEEYEKYVDRKERGNWISRFKRSFQTSKSTNTFYHAVHRLETQIHLFNCAFSGIRDQDVALDIWKKFQEFIQVRCSNEKMTQTDSHIFRIAVVFVDVFRKFPNGQRILEQSSESYESYKTAMYEKQVVGKYERLSKELTEAYQAAEKRESKSKKKPDPGRFYFSRDMLENRGKELDEGKKKFKKKEYRRMYKENNK